MTKKNRYTAPDAWELMRRLTFSFEEMLELMKVGNPGSDDFDAACAYLKALSILITIISLRLPEGAINTNYYY